MARFRLAIAGFGAIALTASVLSVTGPAAATPSTEPYIDVALDSLDDIRDSAGDAVVIHGDATNADGNRQIDGIASSGTRFRVTVYEGIESQASTSAVETIAVASTPDSISVAWLASGTQHTATLPQFGTQVGVEPFASFTGLRPSQIYSLQLDSASTQAGNTESYFGPDADGNLTSFAGPPPSPAPQGSATTFSAILSVETLALGPSASARTTPQPARTAVDTTEFNYRTFIPWQSIHHGGSGWDDSLVITCVAAAMVVDPVNPGAGPALPLGLPGHLTFLGDNRTFEPPNDEATFRTSVDLSIDWELPLDERLAWAKTAGTTSVVLKSDLEYVVDSRSAGMERVFVEEVEWFATDTQLAVTVDHQSSDPYCAADNFITGTAAIDYDILLSFYRDGAIVMVGSRATMPAHETWVRWNSDPWSPLYLGDATGLVCLLMHDRPLQPVFVVHPDGTSADWVTCAEPYNARINRTLAIWHAMWGNSAFNMYQPFTDRLGLTSDGRVLSQGNLPMLAGPTTTSECRATNWVESPDPGNGTTIIDAGFSLEGESPFGLYLTDDGHLYTWASDENDARLGRTGDPTVPTRVDDRTYRDVSTFDGTVVAITTDGDVYRWGAPLHPWLQNVAWVPTLELAGEDVVELSYPYWNALTADGRVLSLVVENLEETWNPTSSWLERSFDGNDIIDIAYTANGWYAIDDSQRMWAFMGAPPDAPMTDYQTREPIDYALDPYGLGDALMVVSEQRFAELHFEAVISIDGVTTELPTEAGVYIDDATVVPQPETLGLDGRDHVGDLWELYRTNWDQPLAWHVVPRPPTVSFTPEEVSYVCP